MKNKSCRIEYFSRFRYTINQQGKNDANLEGFRMRRMSIAENIEGHKL